MLRELKGKQAIKKLNINKIQNDKYSKNKKCESETRTLTFKTHTKIKKTIRKLQQQPKRNSYLKQQYHQHDERQRIRLASYLPLQYPEE